jgi:hypothetical protein
MIASLGWPLNFKTFGGAEDSRHCSSGCSCSLNQTLRRDATDHFNATRATSRRSLRVGQKLNKRRSQRDAEAHDSTCAHYKVSGADSQVHRVLIGIEHRRTQSPRLETNTSLVHITSLTHNMLCAPRVYRHRPTVSDSFMHEPLQRAQN